MALPQLGGYRLEQKLGSGAFGDVFRATKGGKTFALKTVKRVDAAAKAEVEILKKVNYDAIISYFESFVVGRQMCIVMEYADEGTMTEFVAGFDTNSAEWTKGKGAERSVWRLLAHCACAINYLHTFEPVHVLHRDLKPDNILGVSEFDPIGKKKLISWKLADFGIAKLLSHDAQKEFYTNTYAGTPLYMAPEVWTKQSYTFSADIWSLGAVMSFYCNGGSHLFDNPVSIAGWTGGKSSISRDLYSIDLRRLVADLLHPNPKSRPTAGDVMRQCTRERQQTGTTT